MTIDELMAHIEIRQTLAKYSRGVDRWDADILKEVYHPDGIDHHTVYDGTGFGFADFITDVCRKMRGASQHHLTNIYIELHGDAANVETYYIAYHQTLDDSGKEIGLLNTGGRYLDRFEKRNGQWKIAERTCTIDWSRETIAGVPLPLAADFPVIGDKSIDPMYPLFARGAN